MVPLSFKTETFDMVQAMTGKGIGKRQNISYRGAIGRIRARWRGP
ncbi:hypothetical protein HMPREF0762_00228 [Slackia exigua ATCC 700122]|uniref:Uncharacterized protein n=1 Tax=Slackia exigua (strain ATCC 700122 / DSM 15923 / CIP 105133 / JCM 11022 / KCTC 5966 / S-7) TaxID=649764 RepID=D0WEJ9_SLAES|nr:hypothetical protein HMPREF0762_00228 [Slackia exigua ATCC 700122]